MTTFARRTEEDPDRELLAALVGDVDAFARDVWGRRPLLRRSAGDWSHLLGVADLEHLLLTGAHAPTFRLVLAGKTLEHERSTRPVRLGGKLIGDAADLERIGVAMSEGATLVVQGLQRTWLPVVELCRSLERATSHSVQANAYLTPAGAAGLDSHRDDHDVIVVQLEGSKQWRIEGLGDVCLRQGDVVYMPTGTQHSASAQAEPSLHLTVGLLVTSVGAVIHRVIDSLGHPMRAPVPLGFARDGSRDELAAALRNALSSVATSLSELDLDPLVDAEIERARRRRRPLHDGHLASILTLPNLGLSTMVQVRSDSAARLVPSDREGLIVLQLADRELCLPAVGEAALRHLLRGEAVRVSSLPGIDDDSKVVVVRRLVREGAVKIVD